MLGSLPELFPEPVRNDHDSPDMARHQIALEGTAVGADPAFEVGVGEKGSGQRTGRGGVILKDHRDFQVVHIERHRIGEDDDQDDENDRYDNFFFKVFD